MGKPFGLLRSVWVVGLLTACALPPELAQLSGTPEPSAAVKAAAGQDSAATTAEEALAQIEHYVDISGCWRPVGASEVYSDGAPFTIFAIASNTFIINKDARTSFVVREDLSFVEGNRDPDKPFFPPGYIHSTGTISADGLAISRNVLGQSGTKEYRRCANVLQAPPDLRDPVSSESPNPEGTPSPEGTIAPLIPTPTATPEAAASDVPTPATSASPIITPSPTPSVSPTPETAAAEATSETPEL